MLDQKVGFEITKSYFRKSFFGTFFIVSGKVTFTNGLKFYTVMKEFYIGAFSVRVVFCVRVSNSNFGVGRKKIDGATCQTSHR